MVATCYPGESIQPHLLAPPYVHTGGLDSDVCGCVRVCVCVCGCSLLAMPRACLCASIHVSYASEDVRTAGCSGDHAALADVTVCLCTCVCMCLCGWVGVCACVVHQVVETLSVKLNDALEEYIRPRVVSRNFIMQHADYASALNDVILCA